MDPATAADTGLNLVGNFILGGIAIFAVGLMGWAIKSLKQVQDARVNDQKLFSKQLTDFSTQFQESNAATIQAVDKLTNAENLQTQALDRNTGALRGVQQTLDSVVRDAVRGRRTYSSGSMRAHRPAPRPNDEGADGGEG